MSNINTAPYIPVYADKDATYSQVIKVEIDKLEPQVACPHSIDNGCSVTELKNIKVDKIFIGSCTNARIEDLRIVADYVKGRQKSKDVSVMIVPGSKQVEAQAKKEGLDKIFTDAGFQLREPGCSACLGMNEDKIPSGEYCISTSNRNFEGRQGQGARTILASPLMAAAAAVNGEIVDVRQLY